MKQRLLAVLLVCLLILGGSACADGIANTSQAAGQINVFDDCVITINEIAWYGDEEANRLVPASNGAPSILAIRLQVTNRSATSRNFAQDSSLRVRYGTAYNQTGVVAEETAVSSNGLYFLRSAAIMADPLTPRNMVAFVRLSPLLYYSASLLDVQLTIGGHLLTISLSDVSTTSQTGIQTLTPSPTAPTNLRVVVSYLDENNTSLLNYSFLDVPVGGIGMLTPPDIANYVYDHYLFLKDGQWQEGYGANVAVYSDQYGNLDKQQIFLIYRRIQPTAAPVQIVQPYAWDTQFKPGTSTAPDGRGDNANVYLRLPYLYDNNISTSISWLIYVSERNDGIPEFVASFSGATISAIGIRNGKLTSEAEYYAYARLASLRVCIHTIYGETYNTRVYLNDVYSTEYQVLPLDRTYTGVSSIELYLDTGGGHGFYMGQDSLAFTIHVTDMQFYSGNPAQGYYGGGYSY